MTILLSLSLTVLLFAPARPTTQAGTNVSGTVTDESGGVILGAEVGLSGGETPKTTSTNEQGRFAFDGVTPGKYKLQATAPGFEPQELEITAGADPAGPVTVKLKVIGVSAAVAVVDQLDEFSDPETNADAVDFSTGLLEDLPVSPDDVLPLIANFGSSAALGAGGMSILVDGIQGGDVPVSGVSSFKINKNPYSAEFQRPGKGTIRIKTERGSKSSYHASFSSVVRNSVFDARNAFAQSKPDFDRRILSGSFGGPLGGRLHRFFFSGDHLTDNESAVVNAITMAGPFHANIPAPQARGRFLTRYDWRPSPAHSVTMTYGLTAASKENQGVKGFSLPEQAVNEKERSHRFQLSYSAIVSQNLINELHFAFTRQRESSGQPAATPTVVVEGAFTSGPSPEFQSDRKNTSEIQDSLMYVRGKHTIRVGGQSRTRMTDVSDASNFSGTFQFASLQEFASGTPFVFRINRGQPAVNYTVWEGGAFAQDEMRVNSQLNVTLGLRYDWQSSIDDHTQVAPRFGLAFAPGNKKTVLRAGAGVFHDSLPSRVTERSLLFDGIRRRQVVITNPAYPDAFLGGELVALPPGVVRVASDIRSPHLLQSNIALERELAPWTWLSVDYSHLRGVHMFRSRDINAPLPGLGLRPDSGFSNINQVESSASLRSNALTITFGGQAKDLLKATAQYVFSRNWNDASGPFALPADNFNLQPEWGPADFDQRHRFNLAGYFDLPRGFRVGSILSIAGGAPFNITTGFDNNGDTVANDRPVSITRNTGRGPGVVQLDLRLAKKFELPDPFQHEESGKREFHELEFSADAFNALNRTNLTHIVGTMSSPFFGRSNSAAAARTIQFSMKYSF